MPLEEWDDNIPEPGEGFDRFTVDPLDDTPSEREIFPDAFPVPNRSGNIRSGNPGGNLAPPRSPGSRNLRNDTRQVPFQGNRDEPYNTIDVPATRVPDKPSPALPPSPSAAGQIPSSSNPASLPPTTPGNAPQLPGSAPGRPGDALPPPIPGPPEAGVEPSNAPTPADDGTFEPIGEAGQTYNTYVGYQLGVFNNATGQRITQNVRVFSNDLNGIEGPITPFFRNDPSSNDPLRIQIGYTHVQNGQIIERVLFTGGGGNTRFELESFTLSTNPNEQTPVQPRRTPPTTTDRNPGPVRDRDAYPAPLPFPPFTVLIRPNQTPGNQSSPDPGQQQSPFNTPSSNPQNNPNETPTELELPDPLRNPTPTVPGQPGEPTVPQPPPDLDELCEFLRDCLLPSFQDQLRNNIANAIINELLNRLFSGNCSLAQICRILEELRELWLQSDRFELARKNCEGKDIRSLVIGRRGDIVITSLEAGFRYTQELIEEKLPCGRYSESKLIRTGQSQLGSEVSYVPIGNDVRQVELAIVGDLPQQFRIYRQSGPNEEQAKFGAIQTAFFFGGPTFAVGGLQQWCWTRNTLLDVDEYRQLQRYVRVFLEPGLQWALYDTGLRF